MPGADVHLLPRRVPDSHARNEMKLRLLTSALLLVLWAAPAFGQGCAMCYSSAGGSGKEGQRAINRGVMVLLAAPGGFMTIGYGMAFRYGNKRVEQQRSRCTCV